MHFLGPSSTSTRYWPPVAQSVETAAGDGPNGPTSFQRSHQKPLPCDGRRKTPTDRLTLHKAGIAYETAICDPLCSLDRFAQHGSGWETVHDKRSAPIRHGETRELAVGDA